MDNLTHSLAGVLLARAGLAAFAPRATPLCLVAANLADIDIVAGATAMNYLTWHRHGTHSLAAVPLMAAMALCLVEGAARLWRSGEWRPPPWGRSYMVAFVAAATHPIFDLTNVYGTRIWLPISNRWVSWDVLFIIEPWVWAILGAAAATPWLLGRLGRGSGGSGKRKTRAAVAGLALLVIFAGAKAAIRSRVLPLARAARYGGKPALRLAVYPAPLPLNPLRWIIYAETENGYHVGEYLAGRAFQPDALRYYEKAEPGPALEAAWNSPMGRAYRRFAQYPYTRVERLQGGYLVRLSDFRFQRRGRFGFECTIRLNEDFEVVREQFRY